jgi:hypothetical protein
MKNAHKLPENVRIIENLQRGGLILCARVGPTAAASCVFED